MNYEKDEQIEKDFTPHIVTITFKCGSTRVYRPVVLRQSFINKLNEDKFREYNKKELLKGQTLKINLFESEKPQDIKHVTKLISILRDFKIGMEKGDLNKMIQAHKELEKHSDNFTDKLFRKVF